MSVTTLWGSFQLPSINHDPTIAIASYHKGNVYGIINTRKILEHHGASLSEQPIVAFIY